MIKYEKAELEVIDLLQDNVITASFTGVDEGDGEPNPGGVGGVDAPDIW